MPPETIPRARRLPDGPAHPFPAAPTGPHHVAGRGETDYGRPNGEPINYLAEPVSGLSGGGPASGLLSPQGGGKNHGARVTVRERDTDADAKSFAFPP